MSQYRGIAQLVEQRSPKPRAVSSKLTTPAINAQVLRSLCVLFLCACGRTEPFRMASAFALAIFSGNIYFYVRVLEMTSVISRTLFHGKGPERKTACFLLFCNFLKFMLDKQAFFRYNRARSGGKHRTKLERSWPGSSVG